MSKIFTRRKEKSINRKIAQQRNIHKQLLLVNLPLSILPSCLLLFSYFIFYRLSAIRAKRIALFLHGNGIVPFYFSFGSSS